MMVSSLDRRLGTYACVVIPVESVLAPVPRQEALMSIGRGKVHHILS